MAIKLLFLGIAVVTLGIGLYVVVSVLRVILEAHRKPTEGKPRISSQRPQVKFKFLGINIEGGRLFAAFASGIALVAIALTTAVQALPGSTEQPPLRVTPHPDSSEITPTVLDDEPDYEGVRFIKDVRIVDLRSRIPVPPGMESQEVSPVVWTRYSLLGKTDQASDSVQFEFGTTGPHLSPRALTHNALLVEDTSGTHVHGSDTLRTTWRVQVDISQEEVGVPFLIVTEATYWNGFSGEDAEWAAITTQSDTEEVAIIILFPELKPYETFELRACPHGSSTCGQMFDPSVVVPSQNGKAFVWKIRDPKPEYTYQVHWTW